jgi:hypothetical protein
MSTDVSQPTTLQETELNLAAPSVLIGDPTVDGGEAMLDLGPLQSATVTIGANKAMGSAVGPQQLANQVYDRGPRPEAVLEVNDTQGRLIAGLLSSATIPDFAREITAVDTTADTVTVSGDVTQYVSASDVVTIDGSSYNDGDYTIDSLSYDSTNDETTITVKESIGDSTADGEVVGFEEGVHFETTVQQAHTPTLVVVPADKTQHAVDQGGVFWFPAVTTMEAGDLTMEDAGGEDGNSPFEVTLTGLQAKRDQEGTELPDGAQSLFTVPPWKVPLPDGSRGLDWHLPGDYATDSSVAMSLS